MPAVSLVAQPLIICCSTASGPQARPPTAPQAFALALRFPSQSSLLAAQLRGPLFRAALQDTPWLEFFSCITFPWRRGWWLHSCLTSSLRSQRGIQARLPFLLGAPRGQGHAFLLVLASRGPSTTSGSLP